MEQSKREAMGGSHEPQRLIASGTTKFIWDGQDVLLETDGNGNTQVTYTQTPDIYGQIVSQRRGNSTSFYHHDALGSTLALTDGNEAITDTYRFYAFGETLTSSGSTINPYQYVGNLGYYNEAALSLQYLRARYYQPTTGRFVSVDPIRDGVNWYVYVSNRPLTMADPSGLKKKPKPCQPEDPKRGCRLDLLSPFSYFMGSSSSWIKRLYIWCLYSVYSDLLMHIATEPGYPSTDCFALQWFKGYQVDPVWGRKDFNKWTLDGGRPYPYFEYFPNGVEWSDRPGVESRPLPLFVQGSHIMNLEFITCICSKVDHKVDPKPVLCFEWSLLISIDVGKCVLHTNTYSAPVRTTRYPEPCRR